MGRDILYKIATYDFCVINITFTQIKIQRVQILEVSRLELHFVKLILNSPAIIHGSVSEIIFQVYDPATDKNHLLFY